MEYWSNDEQYKQLWWAHYNVPCYLKLAQTETEDKMYVFHVVIVNKINDGIEYDGTIVAASKETAKLLAFAEVMRNDKPDDSEIENFHFAIQPIGDGYSK